MIDWYLLGFSAAWIIGLGLVTASLSYSYYLGGGQRRRFLQALKLPACRVLAGLGLVLFCLGMAGSDSAIWKQIVWGVLALIFALQTWQARKKSNP